MRPGALALAALLIGALGDVLLRGDPWGVNVVLWGGTVVAATMLALRRAPSAFVPLGLGFACLTTFLWRDAEFVHVWSFLALVAGLALTTARAVGIPLATIRIRDGVVAAVESALRGATLAVLLLTRDLRWRWRHAPGTAVGVLLTIPVILVFGSLLRSAEPQFAALTDRLFGWDLPTVASHVALTSVLAWLAAGFLHGLAYQRPWIVPPPEIDGAPRLGTPQVSVPLGSLAAMLLVFAGIQAEYLFGGAQTVLETTGLTVAEYARRGFFELVTIAALVLGLLIAAYAALDHGNPKTVRWYRILSGMLIALVAVVMASALVRMRLYVVSFGLSEDRLYATAFLLWVAVVLGWFAATALRERATRFAYGAVIAGFATILALGVINPHAMVAKTNLARAATGAGLDTDYLRRLDADAIPAVAAAWQELDHGTKCELWPMINRWQEPSTGDWRIWNVARARARRAAAGLTAGPCA